MNELLQITIMSECSMFYVPYSSLRKSLTSWKDVDAEKD